MKDRIINFYNSTRTRWQGLELVQKRRLVMACAGLIVALAVTMFFMVRPDWAVLHNNLDRVTINEMRNVLRDNNIRYRIAQGGTAIEVRYGDLNEALVEVHSNIDVFSTGGERFLLSNALEGINMSTSETAMDQMFRRVDENEIAVSLMLLDGIVDANVSLVVADPRSVFLGNSASSASVVLHTTRPFSQQEALMMANTIAGSVESLSIENVTITDQNLNNIFHGGSVGDDRFGGNSDVDLRVAHATRLENNVRHMLSQLFSDVSVTSNIALNLDHTVTNATTFTEPGGVGTGGIVSDEEILNETAEGTGGAGATEPGAFANDGGVPGTMLAGAQGDFNAQREVINRQYLVNEVRTITESHPGSLIAEESSLSAMVRRDIFVHEDMFTSGNLALSVDVVLEDGWSWETFIQANQFPITMEIEPGILSMLADASGIPVENISVFGTYQLLFIHAPVTPINWHTLVLALVIVAFLALLVFGMMRRNKEVEVIDVEPELSVEDLLVSTQIEKMEEDKESLQEIAYSIDNEVKQQIDKFVNEKPEAVAQLLRSWMNEGWE